MFELLNLDSILNNPGPWLMIFLLILVVWLIRVVTDVRKEVTTVKDQATHQVTDQQLNRVLELNNIRQLERIRNSIRRAFSPESGKAGSGRLDLEIQAEINLIKRSNGNEEDHSEDDSESDTEHQPSGRERSTRERVSAR